MANPVWNAFQLGRERGDEMVERRRAQRAERETRERNVMIGQALGRRDKATNVMSPDYGRASEIAFDAGELDTGLAIQGLGEQAQDRQRQTAQLDAETLRTGLPDLHAALTAIRSVPLEQRAVEAQQHMAMLERLGLDVDQIDDDFSDATLDQEIAQIAQYLPEAEGFSLSEGQDRFDAQGRLIASNPKNEGMTDYQRERLDIQRATGDRQAAAAERAADQTQFTNERSLRSDFDDLSKDYREVSQMMSNIRTVGARGDAAGDLALIVAYTKLLDPGSVAREGEVRLTQSTESALQTAQMMVPRLEQGGTLLPPEVRTALVEAAGDMFAQYQTAYDRRAAEYGALADEYGFDRRRVLGGYTSASAPSGGGGADIPQEAADMLLGDPSPQAQAEFDEVFGQGAAAAVLGGGR
jgi:hypothetical protein